MIQIKQVKITKTFKSINSEKKINTENISVTVSFKPPKKYKVRF